MKKKIKASLKLATIVAFLATAIVAMQAAAEETNAGATDGTIVKKDLSGYQTMDMNQFKQVEQIEQNKNSKVFSVTCKGDNGVEIKPEDPQYRSCMEHAQQKALTEKAKKSN